MPLDERYDQVFERYQRCNQHHVFHHWQYLTSQEKCDLLTQLESIEIEKLSTFLQSALREKSKPLSSSNDVIKPFSGKVASVLHDDATTIESWYSLGLDATRQNKVAALLLAGGQGTRLGFDGPKGMYDIGLPSGSSLFCIIAQRISRLIQLAQRQEQELTSSCDNNDTSTKNISLPLYIMTSPMNDRVTRDYFESNSFFGLPQEDVVFFSQGTLPCLSPEGKILMETPYKCAMAPDGNGGVYPAMNRCGILSDMSSRGIEHIHAFAIDNALAKPADPAFIGYCLHEEADAGNKSVWKSEPHEKVGVVAERNGKPCIVEYSELSKDMAEMVVPSNDKNDNNTLKLVYGAGNICNHYFTLSFLKNVVIPQMECMYHIAEKKIGTWNEEEKKTVTPLSNNGIKLESFIFDVFTLLEKNS